MPKITIDGQVVQVADGTTIIAAADSVGIAIPRFCYHQKLSIAANCRMCLVEVAKTAKPLPACATVVADGMEVHTKSELAVKAQQGVMEFLLINHPLDCPVCDQAGECELQDLSLGYGSSASRYKEAKRAVVDEDLGPLIATEMTRCIHCTRCVRFGEEIAGVKELGLTGRGEDARIASYLTSSIDSEISGNIIDLCPVGALTAKPSRFKERAWQLQQQPGVSLHDCLGSNLYYHVSNNEIVRVVPRSNSQINDIWLADRDRFSYEAFTVTSRLKHPLIKENGNWRAADWGEALQVVTTKLQTVLQQYGPEQIGGLISPNASIEECFLWQKLLRKLGSNNIDHRLRQVDCRMQDMAPLYPSLGIEITELASQQNILLVGSNLHHEQPLLAASIRQAAKNGCVMTINPMDVALHCPVTHKYTNVDLLMPLLKIAKAMNKVSDCKLPAAVKPLMSAVKVADLDCEVAKQLLKGEGIIIFGQLAMASPNYSILVAIANLISKMSKVTVGCLTDGANSSGAWLAGCVPHRGPGKQQLERPGRSAAAMLNEPLAGYLLMGVEPEDILASQNTNQALQDSDCVIAITAFEGSSLLACSDVLLPLAVASESFGTYVNVVGMWQQLPPAVSEHAESKMGWKIIQRLGQAMQLDGFNYVTAAAVSEDLTDNIGKVHAMQDWQTWYPEAGDYEQHAKGLTRVSPVGLYNGDQIARRAMALQETNATKAQVIINPQLAEKLQVESGELLKVTSFGNSISLPVKLSKQVALDCVLVPQVNSTTNIPIYAEVSLTKEQNA